MELSSGADADTLFIHLVLVGESRPSHWTNQLSFNADLYVTLLGPSRVRPPVRGRWEDSDLMGCTLVSSSGNSWRGGGGEWLSGREEPALSLYLLLSLEVGGRCQVLLGSSSQLKKQKIKTLLKFSLKFVLNPNIWGDFLIIISAPIQERMSFLQLCFIAFSKISFISEV